MTQPSAGHQATSWPAPAATRLTSKTTPSSSPSRHLLLESEPVKQQPASVKTSDGLTMMHILKANIGTGVLAMPNAFKNVGLWPGLVLVPLIGAVCIHCMNILIESHNKLCDRFDFESLDYDQVAALGLACGPRWARRSARRFSQLVTGFLVLTQLGFCCVYVMFAAENLQLAALNLFAVQRSTGFFLLLLFPLVGLTSCTSNLRHLARISTLANGLQLAGLGLILVDLLAGGQVAGAAPVRGVPEDAAHLFAGLPLFFATAVYAFEGIGVVLPLVKEMERPGRILGLSGVLNSSMYLVGLLYLAVGFFGYAKYGELVQSSITLNLPETALNELVRLAFATAIGLSYCLQFYVPWTILWPHLDEALFYSYRPRSARDKLQVLDQLEEEEEEPAPTTPPPPNNTDDDLRSDASTLATSYATAGAALYGSMGAWRPRDRLDDVRGPGANRRHLLWARRAAASASYQQQQQQQQQQQDEVEVEDEDEDEDELPQVQWRPPPRSMRGKRKLVRYTAIMLTVALTFVAAALIPRLDLLIALIGSLASSCLAIIFPALIQMCAFWTDRCQAQAGDPSDEHDQFAAPTKGPPPVSAKWCFLLAKNLFILAFGVCGLVTGTWVSLQHLSAGGPAELPD